MIGLNAKISRSDMIRCALCDQAPCDSTCGNTVMVGAEPCLTEACANIKLAIQASYRPNYWKHIVICQSLHVAHAIVGNTPTGL